MRTDNRNDGVEGAYLVIGIFWPNAQAHRMHGRGIAHSQRLPIIPSLQTIILLNFL